MNEATIIENPTEFDSELRKANLTQAHASELKSEWDELMLIPITDKQTRSRVDAIRKKAKAYRLAGTKIFDHEIARRYQAHKEAIRKRNEVLQPFTEVEDEAATMVEQYDNEVAEQERLAEEARQNAINQRMNRCREMGFTLNNGVWTLESLHVEAEDIIKADEATWANLLKSMNMVAEEVAARREQEMREAEEVRAKLEQLKKAEEEVREKERAVAAQLAIVRQDQLLAMGALPCEIDHLNYTANEADWSVMVNSTKKVIEARREMERQEAQTNEWVDTLRNAGWSYRKTDDTGAYLFLEKLEGDDLEAPVSGLNSDVVSKMFHAAAIEAEARKQAHEKAVAERAAAQERERIEREVREEAEAHAAQIEQERQARMDEEGDRALITDALLAVSDCGIRLKELRPLVKAAVTDNAIHDVLHFLRRAVQVLNEAREAAK